MTTMRVRTSRRTPEMTRESGSAAVLTAEAPTPAQLDKIYARNCMKGLFCAELGSVCQEGYCDNCIVHEP